MAGVTPASGITWRDYRPLAGKYLAFQWPRLALLGVLLFTSIGLQVLNPQILRFFVDSALAGAATEVLLQAGVVFFVIALISELVSIAASYVGQWVSFAAVNLLRADLAAHCLQLDMSFHNRRTPGEMIQRIDGDVSVLGSFFSNLLLIIVGNALLLLAVLIILWAQEWRMGLALTLWVIAGLWALNRTRAKAVPPWRALSQASAEYSGFLEERLGGIDDIHANGAVAYVLRRMALYLRTIYQRTQKARWMAATAVNTYLAMFVSGNIIALGFGSYLYGQGEISLGTVYLVFTYTSFVVIPLRQMADQFQYLQQAGASLQRVQELFKTTSRVQEAAQVQALPSGALSCELDGVSFAYGEADAVLHEIDLRLAEGRVLGVLGRTGSGKTTISRLIARLYDPTGGRVCLGGVDIREASLSELRRRVALVTQDVQLFHASVRDNLTFFDRGISDERLLKELEHLGLGEWLAAQPQGLDTLLAPSGGNLSAGQAQLLALARAFMCDPSLVILDEASSRLDPATERWIQAAVERLLAQRTGIIIAHRLETIQRTDEILILENGRIQEYGERAQLAHDPNSRFSQLLRTGMEEVLV